MVQIGSVPSCNSFSEKKVLVWRSEKKCIGVLDIGKMFIVCFWQLDVPGKETECWRHQNIEGSAWTVRSR